VTARHPDRGFVAVEWVAAVALLLLPVVVLVGTLPAWTARRHAATVAAQEAARAVRFGRVTDESGALFVARAVAGHRGVPAEDVTVQLEREGGRGGTLTVRVRMRMPAIAMPFAHGGVGRWTYTAEHHLRVDDYRSR